MFMLVVVIGVQKYRHLHVVVVIDIIALVVAVLGFNTTGICADHSHRVFNIIFVIY